MLNANLKCHYTPNQEMCVDQSLSLSLDKTIKISDIGIKLFKLCSNPGYTVKVQIYAEKTMIM